MGISNLTGLSSDYMPPLPGNKKGAAQKKLPVCVIAFY